MHLGLAILFYSLPSFAPDPTDIPVVEGATFGSEAEFRRRFDPEAEAGLVRAYPSFPDNDYKQKQILVARTDLFPFLEAEGVFETDEPNKEVITLPTNRLETAIEQMKLIKSAVPPLPQVQPNRISTNDNPDQAGPVFHFRVRIPKKHFKGLSEEEIRGWVSRIGDSIHAWRLETSERPHLSLRSENVSRMPPSQIHEKGTIKLTSMGNKTGQYDFEIRGGRGDIDFIKKMAVVILKGASAPEKIQGYAMAQEAMSVGPINFEEHFDSQIKQLSSAMSDTKKSRFVRSIETLNHVTRDGTNLPLLRLTEHPFFELPQFQKDRTRILQATKRFNQGVEFLLEQIAKEKSPQAIMKALQQRQLYVGPLDADNSISRILELLYIHWGKNARLHDTIQRTLLFDSPPPDSLRLTQKELFFKRAMSTLKSHDDLTKTLTLQSMKPYGAEISPLQYRQQFARNLLSNSFSIRSQTLDLIAHRKDDEAIAYVRTAIFNEPLPSTSLLNTEDTTNAKLGGFAPLSSVVPILKDNTSEAAKILLFDILTGSKIDSHQLNFFLVELLKENRRGVVLEALEKAYLAGNKEMPELQQAIIKAMANSTHPKTFDLLKKWALKANDMHREVIFNTMRRRQDPGLLDYAKEIKSGKYLSSKLTRVPTALIIGVGQLQTKAASDFLKSLFALPMYKESYDHTDALMTALAFQRDNQSIELARDYFQSDAKARMDRLLSFPGVHSPLLFEWATQVLEAEVDNVKTEKNARIALEYLLSPQGRSVQPQAVRSEPIEFAEKLLAAGNITSPLVVSKLRDFVEKDRCLKSGCELVPAGPLPMDNCRGPLEQVAGKSSSSSIPKRGLDSIKNQYYYCPAQF